MSAASPRPNRLEVADILRVHGASHRVRHPVSAEQARVMTNLAQCRTAALGGHVDSCDGCGYVRVSYNSCRDRHCPKCQAAERAAWIDARLERLLPVPYFHVVFTLPEPIQPLALRNRRVIYDLLFRAASQTLRDLSADPKRLGGQIGFTAVLHTWGQKLLFHPHLHCVVTGGGLSPDGTRWIAARPDYLLPVKVLSRLFRGKFLAGLKEAFESGALTLTGRLQHLAPPRAFERWLSGLYRQKFVVYAKPPFGGPEIVYRYLGRYTHRVAISNSRLLALEANVVRFQYKDYADGDRSKELSLSADEFLRRFLLHVLPKGFVRIRHYGLLAGPNVATKLERCRQLLSPSTAPQRPPAAPKTWADRVLEWTGQDVRCCPCCAGPLRRESFERGTHPRVPPTSHAGESIMSLVGDTS